MTLIAAAMMSGESTLVGSSQCLKAHQAELLSYLPNRRKTLPSLATVWWVSWACGPTALEYRLSTDCHRSQVHLSILLFSTVMPYGYYVFARANVPEFLPVRHRPGRTHHV